MDKPDHPFWDWSLEVYARPGVEEMLLDLQNRLGLDINILLFACWRGATGRRPLSVAECEQLLAGTAAWRKHVVEPLRAIRAFLKGETGIAGSAALRQKVKLLELEAEHAAQLAIAGLAENWRESGTRAAAPAEAARAGLEACLAAARVAVSEGDRAILAAVAGACCGYAEYGDGNPNKSKT